MCFTNETEEKKIPPFPLSFVSLSFFFLRCDLCGKRRSTCLLVYGSLSGPNLKYNYDFYLQGCDREEKVKTEEQENAGVSSLNSTRMECALQGHDKSNTPTEENLEDHDASGGVPSESPLVSTAAMFSVLRGSPASSCEGARAASTVGPNSSHGRLSSCSTVKITEEQLKLNPVKPEVGSGGKKICISDLSTNPSSPF